MNMREQFISTTIDLVEKDERVSVLLGGISVASFESITRKYPNRAFDAGICEQAIVGTAAGMSIAGMIPIIHTIAPFLVERAYEQLKIDFGYQKQRGMFITTGASLDYSSFGATHQCPADVNVLSQIPGMQIIVPGTSSELDRLFRQTYDNDYPTYIRTSRDVNKQSNDVTFGKANVIKLGGLGTIIAIGPTLDMVMEAVSDLDVTVLYYTTLFPFDSDTLKMYCNAKKILVCEPFYTGGLLGEINSTFSNDRILVREIGIPHVFAKHYGYTKQHYEEYGITVENIRNTMLELTCEAR